MVFARAKLVLEDKCFEEDPGTLEVNYAGPNISKLYHKVYDLARDIFSVPESEMQEIRFDWEKGKDGDKFRVRWWIHKDLDVFSYIYARIDLSGKGTDENGRAQVRVKAWLRSEYPQDTVWQRSIVYEMLRTFWHRIFYRQKREEYIEECRHLMIFYEKSVKEYLKLGRAND